MQFITRGKLARSHADSPPACLLRDAVYQDHSEKKVQTGASSEGRLRKLADKANGICEQHHLPEDTPVIIIPSPTAKKPSVAYKDICINAIYFGRKRRSHISTKKNCFSLRVAFLSVYSVYSVNVLCIIC